MSSATLFFTPIANAWGADVSDPILSETTQAYLPDVSGGLNAWRTEQILLDEDDTRSITIQGLALADSLVFWCSVVGHVRMETVAKDTNGSTTINGYIPTYGTARYPGKLFLSTYNISSVTLRGLADDTVVEFGFFRVG
jgi:hypothetical protein